MRRRQVRGGLSLPIAGELGRSIELLADDYVGLRPTMHVSVGDTVPRG